MTRRNFGAGVLSLALLVTAGCARTLPTYRYRLTVEVDTPQGLKTGSSVIEVRGSQNTRNALGDAAGKINMAVRGEAVAVDLPRGRVLFALLSLPGRSEGAAGYAEDALPGPIALGDDGYVQRLRALKARRDVGVLPAKVYPMLVTFRDLRNPKSVVTVNPSDLAKDFGAGITLNRITVQITNDPVTSGINKRLIWLEQMENFHYAGRESFEDNYPVQLTGLRSKYE